MAIDWKSNNFIYACFVSDYTYASHGSYNSSNARITWWDNSYNSVTKSGSNILLDSATYVPAVLTSACNPFWTKSTTENIYYTNAAKTMGFWGFTYTLIDTYTDYITMNAISSRRTNDNNYYTYGTDYFGNIVTGTYINTDNKYDILNDSGSIISQYYVFKINSSNSGYKWVLLSIF